MAKLTFIKYKKKKKKEAPKTSEPLKKNSVVNDEVAAAISLALSLYMQDVHDYERAVVTIQKVMRPYSPWSSKIYGLRQIPFRFPRHLK
jgi:glutaconyl-CoA/methylmalonyl-CoA decarboxylase subunit delta